jgi:hypothetical protein
MPKQARLSFVRGVGDFELPEEKEFPARLTENVRTEVQSMQIKAQYDCVAHV